MLRVFCAGVAKGPVDRVLEQVKPGFADTEIEVVLGGSVAGVNRLIAGERFDVMVLADTLPIEQMLMPEYVDGYYVWGGNSMVVMGNGITADNWAERLCDPASIITHRNPYDDPAGYRAVMAIRLADGVEPGLAGRILANPGYRGLDRAQYEGAKPPAFMFGDHKMEDGCYDILYKTAPVAWGMDYAELPGQMNLGDPAFEKVYRSVSFTVDGGEEIFGSTILHAVCIPKACGNLSAAEAFVRAFLRLSFSEFGFTKVSYPVGEWNIDAAAPGNTSYSYRDLLPRLTAIPLFDGIDGEAIISLLDALQVEVVLQKEGEMRTADNAPDPFRGMFGISLLGPAVSARDEREDPYQNPGFGELGQMMGEIPAFTELFKGKAAIMPPSWAPKGLFKVDPSAPAQADSLVLRFTPEQFSTFVPEVAEAQGKMIRNMLGLLAQKVTDTRKQLFSALEKLGKLDELRPKPKNS